VLAVELVCAAQAIDFRRPDQPAAGTAAVHAAIREVVPHLDADRMLSGEIETVADMVRDGTLVAAAVDAVGELR
jgi:histidine ammonia-lyase